MTSDSLELSVVGDDASLAFSFFIMQEFRIWSDLNDFERNCDDDQ